MSFITKYGTIWGAIPQTAGSVYWVAPSTSYTVDGRTYDASDDNDGLSPERALLTVDRPWNLVKANAGDVIVLLHGTHSPSASIAADVAGVTMMGLPGGRGNYKKQKVTIAAVTGDQNINVTAANIEIAYINLIPVTTESSIDISAAGDNFHIHNCSFDMETPGANTGTIGVDYIGAASDGLIEDCFFVSDGAQGPAIVVGATLGLEVRNCNFHCSGGTWANVMTQAAAGRELLIRGCVTTAGNGAITDWIVGTTSGEVSMCSIYNCVIPDSVTLLANTYDVGDCEIAENYQAGLGAGDGGVLVTATT